MDILIADLDEDRAGFGEQVAGDGEAVAQVGEVGVDAIAPGVAEGFDLLRFAGDVRACRPSHRGWWWTTGSCC